MEGPEGAALILWTHGTHLRASQQSLETRLWLIIASLCTIIPVRPAEAWLHEDEGSRSKTKTLASPKTSGRKCF